MLAAPFSSQRTKYRFCRAGEGEGGDPLTRCCIENASLLMSTDPKQGNASSHDRNEREVNLCDFSGLDTN